MIHTKSNKYDKMLILLVMSVVFGNIGNLFSPIFYVAIFFLPTVISLRSPSTINQGMMSIIVVLAYLTISLLWVPRFAMGLQYLYRITLNFVLVYDILVLSHYARKPLPSICYGWLIAFGLSSVMAIWEISTDNHIFEVSEVETIDSFERHFASVTFFNPNSYSLFVVMAFPFIMFLLQEKKTKLEYYFYLLIIIILVYIILKNGSRGATLSIGLMFLVFAMNGLTKKKNNTLFFSVIFVLLICFYFSEKLLDVINYRNETQGMLEDAVRPILWQCSWDLFILSNGFGQGCGSMTDAMAKYEGNITPVDYSHNLVLELLLTGGVIITFFYFRLMFLIIKKTIKMEYSSRKIVLISSLLSFPIYSVINSQYIYPTFIWVFFASLYVFASDIPKRNNVGQRILI